jgi:phosphatidyl-myo-inositol dimannoside synthase
MPHTNPPVNDPATRSTHITALFPEILGVGGIQEASRLTALALHEIAQRRRWSTNFLSLNDTVGAQKLSVNATDIAFQGFARAKTRFTFAAIRAARAANRNEPHIILALHPNLAPIAVWMQQTLRCARAIVFAHGVEVWQPLPLVRRIALRNARIVAGPSSDTVQKLSEVQSVPPSRTRLLPWPLNPDLLRLSDRGDLPTPPDFPHGKVILTIARAAASEQYKGTDALIGATAQLQSEIRDVHLVVIGGGDDLPRLQRLAKESSAAGNIHFSQHLSREELASCYARADVFAMPSAGEGFGFVFLEAMAFRKPIVAAAAGGAIDLVQDGINGLLVPPGDQAGLTAALRRLLNDESFRSALGAKGTAIVREGYRFESFEADLERLLDECTP